MAAALSLDSCVADCGPLLIYFRVNSATVLVGALLSRLLLAAA